MGRTIITHLISGNPKGIQSIQLSNRTIKAFVIPRVDYKKAEILEELEHSPCLYILLDQSHDNLKNSAYIGQTDDFTTRIYQHNKNKDFWNVVIVFTSNTLNKADVLYLEYLAIHRAKVKGIYDINENKQNPKKTKLQRHAQDTLHEFFDKVVFISNFRGIDIFKSEQTKMLNEQQELFFSTGRKSDVKGFYDDNGFTVLKGSVLAPDEVNSFSLKEKRKEFIKEYTQKTDNKIVLKIDYTFQSPSTAASYCMGSSSNGWLVWKNQEGKTLDAIFRGE